MNKATNIKIFLIILLVVLIVFIVYTYLINKTVSLKKTEVKSEFSMLETITLPSYCSVSVYTGSTNEKEWTLECSDAARESSRGFMGSILKDQGWKFCDSQTATAHWWKNGVMTGISESPNGRDATSYLFSLSQNKMPECQ